MGARLGFERLKQGGQGRGEEEDGILITKSRGGHQAEDFLLFIAVSREKGGELAFLGTTDHEIGHQSVLRVHGPEETEQVALIFGGDPALNHWNRDFAERRIIELAALGHDRIQIGGGQIAGGLHPAGGGCLLEDADGLPSTGPLQLAAKSADHLGGQLVEFILDLLH